MEYFFADYNWIERKILSYSKKLKSLGITDVVGISRGGIFPASVAAFELDIKKIHLINFDRKTENIEEQLHRPITKDSIVLLCEDVAGSGITLQKCYEYIKAKTDRVYILTIYHDKLSRIIPEFSEDFGDIESFLPWDRYRFNKDSVSEYKNNRILSKNETDYYKFGSDLDGVFLPDIDDKLYQENLQEALKERAKINPYPKEHLPDFNGKKFTIITGRPSCDFEITKNWLEENQIEYEKLLMRDEKIIDFSAFDDHYTKSQKSAESKALNIKENGITHYFESDPLQSTLIACKLPMVKVYWWNNKLMVRKLLASEEFI
jgi:hypoxanthine phosphoribosyltransferase